MRYVIGNELNTERAMRRWDEKNASVLVFTKKDGLLSAVAHDLQLRVASFQVTGDEEKKSIEATFDPSSLRVVCAMHGEREAPDALSAHDRSEIEKNIVKDVLQPKKFPALRFVASFVDDASVRGELTLCGITRVVRVERSEEAGFFVGRATLDQREFGIKPFSAMLGTLKIQPQVEVVVRLGK